MKFQEKNKILILSALNLLNKLFKLYYLSTRFTHNIEDEFFYKIVTFVFILTNYHILVITHSKGNIINLTSKKIIEVEIWEKYKQKIYEHS